MSDVTDDRDAGKVLAESLARPFTSLLVAALRDPAVVAAFRNLVAPPMPPPPPVESALLKGPKLAQAIGVSKSTLNRLVRDGLPRHVVGAQDRFDLAEVRAWLAARGKKPAAPRPAASDEDSIDVSGCAASAGLRLGNGGAR